VANNVDSFNQGYNSFKYNKINAQLKYHSVFKKFRGFFAAPNALAYLFCQKKEYFKAAISPC
jgi:hypothetical protein